MSNKSGSMQPPPVIGLPTPVIKPLAPVNGSSASLPPAPPPPLPIIGSLAPPLIGSLAPPPPLTGSLAAPPPLIGIATASNFYNQSQRPIEIPLNQTFESDVCRIDEFVIGKTIGKGTFGDVKSKSKIFFHSKFGA